MSLLVCLSVQDYLECISNQSRLALSSEDKGSLFGNIQDIYHFNRYELPTSRLQYVFTP